MVDDVQDNLEPHQQKGGVGQVDNAERMRAVRERREAEQRRRLDELRAHAAAAQAQRDQREAERRRRAAEQRAKEEDRRQQVEERKRAIWEAGVSRREALLRREREREERVERQRASRPGSQRAVFAFGSSTPRMLEPADTGGIFWGHRRASSTSNVMFTSAQLTRRSSTFDLDRSERDKKVLQRYDSNEQQTPPAWSSVARRRTDLVPTIPAPRPAGRAYSMTRLDRIQPQRTLHRVSPSMSHLAAAHKKPRSGETTPGSRPSSALSQSSRRPASTPRRPRPASIAGTPRGVEVLSKESTPTVSRDATFTSMSASVGAGAADVVLRRPSSARRPRPVSMHATPTTPVAPGEGKPPLHRKPKPSKDQDKTPSRSGGRVASSESSKEPTPARDIKIHRPAPKERQSDHPKESNQVNAAEVTQKLEALQLQNKEESPRREKTSEVKQNEKPPKEVKQNETPVKILLNGQEAPKLEVSAPNSEVPVLKPEVPASKPEITASKPEIPASKPEIPASKPEALTPKPEVPTSKHEVPTSKPEVPSPKPEVPSTKSEAPKSEASKHEVSKPETPKPEHSVERTKPETPKSVAAQEKTEETDMTASMIARNRITTEEEAKAALAERRRKAREELERQAQLERERLAKEAEEEAERQRQEEERQRQLEEEARELAELQRKSEEEKLRKAIEAQQQLEREARERAAREEAERLARLREEREERAAREAAEAARRGEAEREEAERRARKQRVEAIMLRTRKKAEEEKKQQESKNSAVPPPSNQQSGESQESNGQTQAYNTQAVDLLGLNTQNVNTTHIANSTVDFLQAEINSNIQNSMSTLDTKADKTVDLLTSNVDLMSSNVSQNVQSNVDLLTSQLVDVKSNGDSKEENGYTIHNGHKENNGLDNVLNNGSQYSVSHAV